jgi:AraC-like DNA-binding protein
MSFNDYLRESRTQEAADLSRRTRLTIQRIAASVAQDAPSRFVTHFRRRFSLTPRDFRRQFGEAGW